MSDSPPSPIEREVLQIKLDAARKLAEAVRRVDVSVPGNWSDVVEGTRGAGVRDEDICRTSDISYGTLERWASGKAVPVEVIRGSVRDGMARLIDDLAERTEARLALPAPDAEPTGPGL